MRKERLVIIGIIALIIIVGVSAGYFISESIKFDNEMKRFIGTWNESRGDYSDTYYFNSDGTYNTIGIRTIYGPLTMNLGNYTLKDGKLVITSYRDESIDTYDYIFSNNDLTLTLIPVNDGVSNPSSSVVYIKVSSYDDIWH